MSRRKVVSGRWGRWSIMCESCGGKRQQNRGLGMHPTRHTFTENARDAGWKIFDGVGSFCGPCWDRLCDQLKCAGVG